MARRRKLAGYILLVDHPPYVHRTRDHLLETGYGVIQAESLEATESLVNAIIPDLILIHHTPKILSSQNVCRVLQGLAHVQSTPIILWLSSADPTFNDHNWTDLGVQSIIRTSDLQELTDLVRQNLYSAS